MKLITTITTAAAVAMLAMPATAIAHDNEVAEQANKVAQEAKDLQQASNTLDQTVAGAISRSSVNGSN